MPRSFAGLRIRERRRTLGLSQTALAHQAGISPSYLNLIEHNRRPVAGKVLLALARALDVPAAALGEQATLGLVATLREAAADLPVHEPETHLVEEFVGRYPGWARMLSTLDRSNREQRTTIEALGDRLTHDPVLQSDMHEMLTTITAIRSTASILATVDDIEVPQRQRFTRAIHDESQRLSEVAGALTDYFDRTASTDRPPATPEEEIARILESAGYAFPELTDGADIEDVLDRLCPNAGATRTGLQAWLTRWLDDALAIPDSDLLQILAEPLDLTAAARAHGVTVAQLMRRLAFRQGDMPLGLIEINGAGQILLRRPLPDWPISRQMAACPLLPIFDALLQPGMTQPVTVEMPGGQSTLTICTNTITPSDQMGQRGRVGATMLLVPNAAQRLFALNNVPFVHAGPGCRVCARTDCSARIAEPVIAR
ncbi:hypothetical protein SAMN06273572_10955 [Monaibacterium marinum]|uniref:HTH cro/C1-type domain-containing protein n=1 Tax=Pontivivens marinum TaxID=1690039 RepID=A0A2C9CVA3_9RHOB|nr:short-chain fatty acyl-CoA regulator family protein [Monaibacterium marinum]SOH95296.1 hypothetical protein SAMN06273572_10955 [Monaibacterium marinum]